MKLFSRNEKFEIKYKVGKFEYLKNNFFYRLVFFNKKNSNLKPASEFFNSKKQRKILVTF